MRSHCDQHALAFDLNVLALPRGGVAIGVEVARALAAPLDLVLVRKIGSPGNEDSRSALSPMTAIPSWSPRADLHGYVDVSQQCLEKAKAAALQELERRRRAYLGERPPLDLTGRTAIVVDDGMPPAPPCWPACAPPGGANRHASYWPFPLRSGFVSMPIKPYAWTRQRISWESASSIASSRNYRMPK